MTATPIPYKLSVGEATVCVFCATQWWEADRNAGLQKALFCRVFRLGRATGAKRGIPSQGFILDPLAAYQLLTFANKEEESLWKFDLVVREVFGSR